MELKNKKIKEKAKTVIQENNEAIIIGKKDDFPELSKKKNKNFLKINFKDMPENKKRLFLVLIPWILLIIFLISSFFLWMQLSDIKKDPLKLAQEETSEVVLAVGKIIVLPNGEIPKIATLTAYDLNKVKTQSFFINAKVGDKVLVYSIARKVILYNPNINKIVEVANLNSDNMSQSSPSL